MRHAGFLLALLVMFALTAVGAQERIAAGPPPGGPTFDAASIKRVTELRPGMSFDGGPGRWGMTNGSMAQMIRSAYNSDTSELVGAPSWVEAERYDVMARAEGTPSSEQMTLMLQALLAARLHLDVHYELQDRPVYALLLARADGRLGPNITRSNLDCDAISAARRAGSPLPIESGLTSNGAPVCGMSARSGQANEMLLGGMPLSTLARSLGSIDGRIVVDKTGLDGRFEATLRYTGRPGPNTPDDAPPVLFTAIQEQLGLKLEPARAPLRILVIDRVERPSEN
jgi:uncharacterized protein (TIGR03435 family)